MDIERVAQWQGGRLSTLDPELLELLWQERRTLVTRDVNTMPQHVAQRLRSDSHHGGVIFVAKSFAQNDSRAVIRALRTLIKSEGNADWMDRTHWL